MPRERWADKFRMEGVPMPTDDQMFHGRKREIGFWAILALAVVVCIIVLVSIESCADKTGTQNQSAVGESFGAPDINIVAKITDPDGEVTYSVGWIDIPEPTEGTYEIIVRMGIVTTDITPDSPDGEMRIGIRIDGSVESWIPIDDFGVPVVWEYGPYKLIVTVIDGQSSGTAE